MASTLHEDQILEKFGYKQQFDRTLHRFESFAVGFSFISITTGIFTTFGFVLAVGGPRGIWSWPIVIVGQTLVALIYAALAAKIPLMGYSYQWASRLANPTVGWFLGWLSFAFLAIVTVSVDYAFVQVAWLPLLGRTVGTGNSALWTFIVLAAQAALIILSTRITTRINNTAVATEIIGIVGLSVVLLVIVLVGSHGSFSNLGSTGAIAGAGWYKWLGPFMFSTLLGAYTIVGFESCSNLAEETEESRRIVPAAMWRSVVYSGVIGMVFLIALAAVMDDPAAQVGVADIMKAAIGGWIEKIFLVFISFSIFACGLVIMVTDSRLIYAMSRDKRFPGHQLWAKVPPSLKTPAYSAALAAISSGAILLVLMNNTNALVQLFTASTLMPAVLYLLTVLLYVFTAHRHPTESGYFTLGRWEWPVIVGSIVWLVYELSVLIIPSDFRTAQYYALGAIGVGAVVFVVMRMLEPGAMSHEVGATGSRALEAADRPEQSSV